MNILSLSIKDGEQSVNLPKTLRIDDQKVYAKKIGNAIVLIPFHNAWESLFSSLSMFSDDFMLERNQPQLQTRESLK